MGFHDRLQGELSFFAILPGCEDSYMFAGEEVCGICNPFQLYKVGSGI
jgi:hypothetical protein